MSRHYHGRRDFHLDQLASPQERAEREEQRFRHRHDRLHRQRARHHEPDADRYPASDVLDDFSDAESSDERSDDA